MTNQEIAAILEEIAVLLELKGENPFKARAYENAARTIGSLDESIEELAQKEGLKGIPGLGEALIQKITELVQTGHMTYYEGLRVEIPEGLIMMTRIPGLGPKKAKAIYDQLGIASIDDLKAAGEAGKLAGLPGFGARTEEKILAGIAFLAQYQNQFLYDIAENMAMNIEQRLKNHPHILRASIAGSLRRKKEIVKDIDAVASIDDDSHRDEIMGFFTTMPEVVSITGKGDTKSSVVLTNGMAMDLRLVTDNEYPFALHHFTGSKEHNVKLRHISHEHGLKINEYGIYRGEELLPCADESELYATLGMDFIPPEMREDRGEVEAALEHRLPKLVELGDLKGILHVHSTWSDGHVSIREMALACKKLGYSYLGICDHSKVAAYAHGLTEDRLIEQHTEIDRLNSEFAGEFYILKGTECDILRDGNLDYSNETLAKFDFVVVSVHSMFNLTEEEQTARILKALENPFTSILGHPTGRILLGREGYKLNQEAVIEHAGKFKVSIEINSNPLRLDLDWRYLRQAKEQGVKISINPDAHNPEGLADVRYGIGIARKGWLTASDIINTLKIEDLKSFFTEQRESKLALV